MGDERIRDLARASLEAFNDSDWERWSQLSAPNVVHDEVAMNSRHTGHKEVLDALKAWRTAFPDVRGQITNLMLTRDHAVREVTWRGTHKGELTTPFGRVPPSGRPVTVRSVMVIRVEKDRIVEERHYFDMLDMLRQVGAVPETLTKAVGR
jgi:steroid delta-isomerase-like uncharacterized protein